MLVTGDGEWLLPDTPEFLAALGDPDPDYDSISFAVKNLGFIKFQVFGQSIAEIELHPRNVGLPALLAAQQQVLSCQAKLFRIKYFDIEWRSEISSSAEHVIGRLAGLCAPEAHAAAAGRFVVEPQDFSRVFDDEDNWARPLAVKWRMSFGQFDSTVISLAVTHRLLSRLVIIGLRPRAEEPVFRFIGDGHSNWLEPKYQTTAIGETIMNLPDKEYGSWASQFYKNVARTGQPRYDYVTATIQHPPTVYITRYERLLLPWKTPSDEVLVTLWSKPLDAENEAPSTLPDSKSFSVKKLARSA